MAHFASDRPSWIGLAPELFNFDVGQGLKSDALSVIVKRAAEIKLEIAINATVWGEIASLYKGELEVLAQGEPTAVGNIVNNLFGTNLTHGFLQGKAGYDFLRSQPNAYTHTGAIIMDRFFRLAEAVGVCSVRSREHGQTTIQIQNLDDIMDRIEEAVGADLSPPKQAGCIYGLKLRNGIYSERHFDGIYAAWRAREVALANKIYRPTLCEIGGGAGHLAFYAKKFGFQDIAIIDLPCTSLVQYIVLSSEFGSEAVSFEDGEGVDIHLVQADSANVSRLVLYDIVVNVDSMPEMTPSAAQDYISRLQKGQVFLSINQESGIPNSFATQNVVNQLAFGEGLERTSRHPAWLRTGYVEETFRRL